MTRIVSSVPGRLRLRDHALRRAAVLERLRAMMAAFEGVLSAEGNLVAGSIVLRYDMARVTQRAIESQVEAAAAALGAPRRHRPHRKHAPTQRDINRYAKYGMLGSLAASLAFAAAGHKRWHAATGGLFLVGLGVHLALNRSRLLQ